VVVLNAGLLVMMTLAPYLYSAYLPQTKE
jgi:hypothetical protein